jgi:hypothetical protein
VEVVDGDGDADGGARGGTVESADGGASGARARTGKLQAREARLFFCVCVWFGFFVLGDGARGARRRSVVTRGAFVNGEDD